MDLQDSWSAQKAGDDWRYGKAWQAHEYFCESCGYRPDWMPATIVTGSTTATIAPPATVSKLLSLPDEVVLLMLDEMPTEDVLALADAVPFVKRTVHSYDFIRARELQCFCLKRSYMDVRLGIGVSVTGVNKPVLRSEFDLLSQEAFFQHDVHHSVQGVAFDKWPPLPLSRRHWKGIRVLRSLVFALFIATLACEAASLEPLTCCTTS